jgi:membrane-associated phospholipid phosphatase
MERCRFQTIPGLHSDTDGSPNAMDTQIIKHQLLHPAIPGRWLASALGASLIVVAGMLVHIHLMIDAGNRGFVALAGSALALATMRWRLRHSAAGAGRRLRDFAEYVLTFMAISLLGVLASYALASNTQGFADATLERWDERIGFDWLALYRLVAASPLLQQLGQAAYATIYISPAILFFTMAWYGEREQARRFLLTYWVAVVMTLLVFPLMPARGALDYLWHGPIPYMPTSGQWQGLIIPELRAHTIPSIDLGALRGLVCAPSFHAVSAVLYLAWAWPMPRMRWVLTPVIVAMMISTPIEGVHYLSDMVLGAGVAIVAIIGVRAWLNRTHGAARQGLATA